MNSIKVLILFVIFLTSKIFSQPCQPVAKYDFNNNALDITGHGYDLDTTHNLIYGADRFGNPQSALLSAELTLQTDSFPQPGEDFTYSIWFKNKNWFYNVYLIAYLWLYSGDSMCEYYSTTIEYRTSMGNHIIQAFHVGGSCNNYEGWDVDTDSWNNAVLVCENNTLKLFSGSYGPIIIPWTPSLGNLTTFKIGKYNFYGYLDDLEIYPCALSDSEVFTLYVNEKNKNVNQFQIFPNPVSDLLNINSNTSIIYDVAISDISGKEIKRFSFTGDKSTNVSDLTPGFYMISIYQKDKKVYSGKLLKAE